MLFVSGLVHASPPQLPALRLVVHHFDFEDADAAPNSLPAHFYRYVSQNEGFPPFGTMRLTTDESYSGNSSFEFALGGGSMSARIPTSVIPILPFTDYSVSVKVKTEGLKHAQARLVAWLHDRAGHPIQSTRTQSLSVETAGDWETLSVEIRGHDPEAADLVVELQVLQPSQLTFGGSGTTQFEPRLEDIAGYVWFDDCVVAHLPHVSLRLRQTGNIVIKPAVPEFEIHVNEVSSDVLKAHVQVLNLDGAVVFDSNFPAPRGRSPSTVRIPIDTCGWYRAILHLSNQSGLSRWKWIDFTIVPEQTDLRTSHGMKRFGIVLGENASDDQQHTDELLSMLRCDWAVVPIWPMQNVGTNTSGQSAQLHRMVEQLLHREIDLIFALKAVPIDLAQMAKVEPHQVLEVMGKGSHLWQPYLDNLLVNFGLEVNRWIIGWPDPAQTYIRNDDVQAMATSAHRSLASFVPKPVQYTAWSFEQAMPRDYLPGYALAAPIEIAPTSLGHYCQSLPQPETQTLIVLPQLPEARFTARQRVADTLHRALHLWRARTPLTVIDAPWTNANNDAAMPQPIYGAWRTFTNQLNGREFISALDLPNGMHCWLLRGSTENDSAIVAWSDALDVGGSTFGHDSLLQMQLGSDPIKVTDAFGNVSFIDPIQRVHSVPLNDLPVFIENANINLVQFRGGIRIEPDFVPAIAKVHEHRIVLRNPWNVNISGSIRLFAEDEWKLSPTVQEFAISANDEVHLLLQIIPQRSILAGHKTIAAQITLNADQGHALHTTLSLEVGLQDIGLAPSWTTALNPLTGKHDLIVTQAVTNHGISPVYLDVFLLAEGVEQNRRTIPALGPGETAVRTFRIANGASLLAGQQVRIGVAERGGLTRLNQLLSITPAIANRAANANPNN